MTAILKLIPLALTAALLASCGDEPGKKASREAATGNKVLEGTISDDMLPYDTVQSKPPLAAPSAAAKSEGDEAAQGPADLPADAPQDTAAADAPALPSDDLEE